MEEDFPKLQVALDLMNIKRAVRIAKEAVEGGVDWIEVGTPLIKSEGMDAVRKLREEFPEKKLIADMKTMDVGGVEVEMAAKAGADIIGILGAADDETLKEGIKAAQNYDSEVFADLIRVEDQVKRAEEVTEMGVDYVGVHIGIDAQMKGEDPGDLVEKVSEATPLPVAAAGGLNSETAPDMVKRGADIIIVGGAIIKARDVRKAAENMKKAIQEGVSIESEVKKKRGPAEIKEVFQDVSTPNISDAMHREPCMKGIKPLTTTGKKIVGKALTVKTVDGDWAKPVEAIDRAEEDQIIVIDADAGKTAVWGELASWSCQQKGVEGVIIDGAVRDIEDIRKLGFPVFARYIASNAGEPKGYGALEDDIVCGGRKVRPGDWIIGDDSGVMVVPKEEAVQIANRALDVMEKENRVRQEIKEGRTLSVVMELGKWEKR
ncbi:MAG: orotidine 5'-phosphate decarboxylase [Candidatus Thermoplasmatota archaeon]|nr:orotidine 5'-phosphate decarboxylase [Candidatus Thermoplasmatota archaeon]MBS3790040.1 orotidine 5'-phosphate decarboxylase [Candidatus Thermoplasmatota archaeon]